MVQEVYMPPRALRMIIFGDGHRAMVYNIKENELDRDGNVVTQFWFKPLEHLAYTYKIKDDDYTSKTEWLILREYPAHLCLCLDRSPLNQVWLVPFTYDGKEGPAFKALNGNLNLRLTQTLMENKLLHKQVARLNVMLRNVVENPDAYEDKIMRKMLKMIEIVSPKENKSDQAPGMEDPAGESDYE